LRIFGFVDKKWILYDYDDSIVIVSVVFFPALPSSHGKGEVALPHEEDKKAHRQEGQRHQPLEYPVEVGVEADREGVCELLHDLVCDLDHHHSRHTLGRARNLHRKHPRVGKLFLVEQERASKEDLDSVAPVWRSGQAFVNDLKLNIEARFGRKGGGLAKSYFPNFS